MDESRIKALYRQHTDAARALDADALQDVLGRHGYPDVEGTPLDRIAASSLQSDVLRIAMALGPDAQQLSRDIAALRREVPRRAAAPLLRRTLALAAGVGALAVLFSTLHGGSHPGAAGMAMPDGTQSIMSGSFEPGLPSQQDRIEIEAAAPIFRGDFDS
ncbi:hypothetical protein [Chiayiivirga flava]|uniref:Uncharacterized protein n=1 Tax=Chiayiivirga flava TaxID=659595 RepID=A0A7W8D6L3_9GAMM|nr:hypothetical protein [Chiayiivirga flava]MBB5208858.1 hypothetical protein [Chiayiivirga flava]